jgi:hypothetical protein
MRSPRLVALATAITLCFGAADAFAASVSMCVPTTPGQPLVSGACSGSGTTVALPASSADQQTLISILPYVRFVASGVGGLPTVQFTGANVQIVNGAGSTAKTNGAGNLVLGYDEGAGEQTGSHD